MTPEELAEKVEMTAEVIEKGGWIQEAFQAPEGHCVMGAFRMVTTGCVNRVAFEEEFEFTQAFLETVSVPNTVGPTAAGWARHRVFEFNDEPGRTQQEILDALHKTAKRIQGVDVS